MRFKLSVESDKEGDLALLHRVIELLNGGTAELSEPAPTPKLKSAPVAAPVAFTETTAPVKQALNGEEPEAEVAPAAKRGPGRPRKVVAAAPAPKPEEPEPEETEAWSADLGDEEFLRTVTDFCKANKALNEPVGNLLRQYSVERVTHLPVERRREFLVELQGLKVLQ